MELVLLIPLWLVGGIVVAIISSVKGKTGCAWFIYGFLLTPIAFIHILIARTEPQRVTQRELARGRLVTCPYCRDGHDARISASRDIVT